MIPIDATSPSQTESISLEFDLPHSVDKVWRALSEPALLAEWLFPVADFALERGTAFTFKAPPQAGWDGSVSCRLLDVEPHARISYTWVVGDIDTVVTFALTPTATGTRLSLIQSGFTASQKRNFNGARYGWKTKGGRLVDLLARTHAPTDAA